MHLELKQERGGGAIVISSFERQRDLQLEEPLVENNIHHLVSLAHIYKQVADRALEEKSACDRINALCDAVAINNKIQLSEAEKDILKKPVLNRLGLDKPMTLANELVAILVAKCTITRALTSSPDSGTKAIEPSCA